ncbi:MAG: flagellar biosynthesis anti-sigma factor FlgM [Quinella sp. 2Q5]|nr:flagellar biosynthesis anti-sigma factor FlgM [Quinella sp. 2Q5]
MFINNVNSSAKYYPNSVAASRYANAINNVRDTQKSDAFTPSRAAQSFSEMLGKLRDSSEVRQDKVLEFQQRISSGQYFVSSTDIASAIMTNRF